jgi:hypothetical protein
MHAHLVGRAIRRRVWLIPVWCRMLDSGSMTALSLADPTLVVCADGDGPIGGIRRLPVMFAGGEQS